jgi:RNA polymerase sigma-70 factor (ECF subfamily)
LPVVESDALLVAALRAERMRAPEALLERFGDDIERILYRVLGPDPEIPDLLQDTFIVALTSIEHLRDASALKSWLTGIALRKAKKLIRRRYRWRFIKLVAPSDLPEAESNPAAPEVSEALRATYRILERLPADERIAFALRHIDGMELSSVASAAGVSLATIKRRLSRAHEAFVALARRDESLSDWVEGSKLEA